MSSLFQKTNSPKFTFWLSFKKKKKEKANKKTSGRKGVWFIGKVRAVNLTSDGLAPIPRRAKLTLVIFLAGPRFTGKTDTGYMSRYGKTNRSGSTWFYKLFDIVSSKLVYGYTNVKKNNNKKEYLLFQSLALSNVKHYQLSWVQRTITFRIQLTCTFSY